MKHAPQQTWGGRFSAAPAQAVKAFTESVSFDWRLYHHDIAASIAHAKGLAKVGLLTRTEAAKIERGLRAIERRIDAGQFNWDAACEDVHMNIEVALIKTIGEAGKKLHAARSRNDQVATDLRLWVRDAVIQTMDAIHVLQGALVALAEKSGDVVIPGYTHLQRAQPVLFAHHLLAYVEMLDRDARRFLFSGGHIGGRSPLGSGAIAGSTLKLDRVYVSKLLRFCRTSHTELNGCRQ